MARVGDRSIADFCSIHCCCGFGEAPLSDDFDGLVIADIFNDAGNWDERVDGAIVIEVCGGNPAILAAATLNLQRK